MKRKLLILAIVLIIFGTLPACIEVNHLHKISQFRNSPIYYQNRAVVLLYHNFENIECGTAITPERFEQHLDMLEAEGFKVVSLQEIILFLNGKGRLPPNAVSITMDDGHQSNYTVGYKSLEKRHWPGTVFVLIKNTEEAGSNNDQWLNWEQLRIMSRNNIAIMSHSFNGHQFIRGRYPSGDSWFTTRLPGESQAGYQERIYHDLLTARLILQKKLNLPVESFAPPFGIYNQDVIRAAQKAGYKYIWTTTRQAVTSASAPTELPRVSVGRKDTTAQQLKETIIVLGQR